MAQKAVVTLGPKEFVDFPGLQLVGVPAKIDTGADSSSIWASDIREENGVLSFCLFDRISPFFNGERIETTKFSVASIKNSFGQTEFRYKTRIKAVIGGRQISVQFTLANRENNRMPILIGRRTLHKKFIVDVAKQDAPRLSAMLLISKLKTDNVRNFIKGVEAASENRIKITYATYDDFCFVLDGDGASKITLLDSGIDIATFDIVHFKTAMARDVSAAIAQYLQKRGVPFLDQKVMHFAASSKIYQYVQLADNGIRIPKSVFVMPSRYKTMFDTFKSELGLPFVLKGIHASRGDSNFLVRDEESYQRIVKQIEHDEVYVVGQQFVPNEGDYRVLVLGRRIALVIYRSRKDDTTHLNNTSQGSTATLVPVEDLPTQVQTDCILAAKLLERGVAGVDMLEDKKTGSWYCLEVNDGPQLATGAFVAEKQIAFAKYIETELEKS